MPPTEDEWAILQLEAQLEKLWTTNQELQEQVETARSKLARLRENNEALSVQKTVLFKRGYHIRRLVELNLSPRDTSNLVQDVNRLRFDLQDLKSSQF